MKQIDIDIIRNMNKCLKDLTVEHDGGVFTEPFAKRVTLWNNVLLEFNKNETFNFQSDSKVREKQLHLFSNMIDIVSENSIFGVCQLPALIYEGRPYVTTSRNLGADSNPELIMSWFNRIAEFGHPHKKRHVLCENKIIGGGIAFIIYQLIVTSAIYNPMDFTPAYLHMVRYAGVKRDDDVHKKIFELENQAGRDFRERNRQNIQNRLI